jgi:hypothetical protein
MRALLGDPGPTLIEFLNAWHGPPDRKAALRVRYNRPVPEPLVEWFDVTSRWTRLISVQNRFVEPQRLFPEDGMVTFWVENQAVWLWAYRPGGSDPPVFDRENETGRPWTASGYRLKQFLVRVAVFEAIMGATHRASAAWVEQEQRDAILAPLKPLPGPAWNWPPGGSWLFAGDGLLALAGPNVVDGEDPKSAAWDVFVAAREPELLAYLSDVAGVDWDHLPG